MDTGHIYTFLWDGVRWTLYNDAENATPIHTSLEARMNMLTRSFLVQFALTPKGTTLLCFRIYRQAAVKATGMVLQGCFVLQWQP
jgi:hypothetical protein